MTSDVLDDIRSRLDIVDLISEHVDLKKSGQNYKGLCPFHSEKTPSFIVSPTKQFFHCFGCGKGGDIFTFVMNYENMTFHEAASYLADRAGVKLNPKESGLNKGLKEAMYAITKEAASFFQKCLKDAAHVLSYLKERGVNNDSIEMFSLGYSKGQRDALFNHLKGKGFSTEHIKASGLVNFSDQQGRGAYTYDFFRDRLMFPIFDLQGRTIAFGGRILTPSANLPKYINSSDSLIFKKGENSYGLNIAKDAIHKKGYSIIVEGYMDTLTCHQHGISNAVAPLGTALTLGQLKKIKRFANNTLLLFDSDPAGAAATMRSIELCYSEGVNVNILPLPEGDDPDTFLRKHGEINFRKRLAMSMQPVDFVLKASGKGKLDGVRQVMNLISKCPDPLLRDETIRELADRSRINEITLRDELKNNLAKVKNRPASKKEADDKALQNIRMTDISREEQILLNIALAMPEQADSITKKVNYDIIENPFVKGILQRIKALGSEEKGEIFHKTLFDLCSPEEKRLITMFSVKPNIDEDEADKNIEDCLKRIRIRDSEKRIRQAEQSGDENLLKILLDEKKRHQ
ncbi:MAG: DNA primase [Nitrospirae bacterium]|nr:DNA primase [Nitrospirota bacterium]